MFDINGLPVLAYIQTEVQDGKRCGYVLVDISSRSDTTEYVTAWYREGDRSWCHGNYFRADQDRTLQMALEDLYNRGAGCLHLKTARPIK